MKVILLLSLLTLSNALKLSSIVGALLGGNKNHESENTSGIYPKSCPKSPYRSYDGSCNNLENPSWGTPNTTYRRLLPARYGDGICSLPTSKSGYPLLSARDISIIIFAAKDVKDCKRTLCTMQWGQLLAHDMSLTTAVVGSPITCCSGGQNVPDPDPRCDNIVVPPNDDVHPGQECLNFLRTLSTKDNNCTTCDEAATPLSDATAYMDLSIVYGVSESQAKSLRKCKGGKLKSVMRNGKEWPPQAPNPSGSCRVSSNDEPCYVAGDRRINQNTELTLLHVLLLRKHNKIAGELKKINKHWDDEKLYQEARRIMCAYYQHVNYYELLPIYLGYDNMLEKKLIYANQEGYVNDYNPKVNPAVSVEHATGAFRSFHSTIEGNLEKYLEDREYAGSVRLSTWMTKPSILEQDSNFCEFARGMNTQPQMALDKYYHNETTVYLFRGNNENGTDLAALDLQRGRDHGVPSYNDLRVYCGLPRAEKFEDFSDHISECDIKKIKKIYETPDDVELKVGSILEKPVKGAQVGPTDLCILLDQFYITRIADRFFYENGQQEGSFTIDQLNSIRKGSTIASIFCEVGGIKSIQKKALELISASNPVVPCSEIPTIDLSCWKD